MIVLEGLLILLGLAYIVSSNDLAGAGSNRQGGEAAPGEFPSMVSFQAVFQDKLTHFCAGTLLKPNLVITTSLCLISPIIDGKLEEISVVPGLVQIHNNALVNSRRLGIAKAFNKFETWPNSEQLLIEDIAIVQLNVSANFSGVGISSVDVPDADLTCISPGWGSIAFPHLIINLTKSLPIMIQKHTCQKYLGNSPNPKVLPLSMCSFNLTANTPLSYDMGGPVFCSPVGSTQMFLKGVITEQRGFAGPRDSVLFYIDLTYKSTRKFILENLNSSNLVSTGSNPCRPSSLSIILISTGVATVTALMLKLKA